ncbi:hypothetical protein BX666DRAFT_1852726 [Dichotomocladium elegans]|nr:hypothetical protein BX666DRAFT_1852726 [Dichotomocladium elegans]
MGCSSVCEEATKSCRNVLTLAGEESLLPDCSAVSPLTKEPLQPDQSCNYINTTVTKDQAGLHLDKVPEGFILSTCPAPFVRDPLAKSGSTESMINPPSASRLTYSFYPRHPSLLILNFSIALFLFSMVVFFSVGDTKGLQCGDAINPADQDNNKLCAAQGAILIFGSLASVLWCAALIVNLHLHTVWNSSFLANRYIYLYVICWGVPLAFMIVALVFHAVKFEFANLCLVSIDYIFKFFFYPMAAIVCPAIFIHILTFIYIARMAMREFAHQDSSQSQSQSMSTPSIAQRNQMTIRKHRHVVQAVKIQWRALLLAFLLIGTVFFYWIFYFTQIDRMAGLRNDNETILRWLECMMEAENTQNDCTYVLRNHMPPFGLMITAEALVSIVGALVSLVFIKRSLLREWNDWIYDMRVRGRMEKNGDQFFAL